jgi:hypothetical protein
MENLFSDSGIRPLDFIQISATFLLTMLWFFGVKGERRFWPNFMLVVFTVQCLVFILFREGLQIKLFAALMLISTFVVRALVGMRRTMQSKSSVVR